MTDAAEPPVEAVDGRAAYDVPFVEDSSHGHVVALLREHARPGLIVDIGCGYAPHATPLRELGFDYVGVDADESAVMSLRERGFTATLADADDPDALIAALDDAIDQAMPAAAAPTGDSDSAGADDGARVVSAVLALDVLEHLVSPHLTLGAIVGWMRDRSAQLLGLSLPNVSHQDVALKLLAGHFDLTPTGLLDHTHLRFFTDRSVGELTERVGLAEIARHDVRSPKSDQDWPEQHPMLSDGALLGTHLRRIRALGDEHGTTFQFVRLFSPVPSGSRGEVGTGGNAATAARRAEAAPGGVGESNDGPTLLADRPPSPERAITVLVTAGASAAEVAELQRHVDAQAAGTARLRPLRPDDDLAAVLDELTTAYVTFARGGDRFTSRWAASVLSTADRYPAAAVRSGPLESDDAERSDVPGGAVDVSWVPRFSPFDHYVDDATPGAAMAFPLAHLRDMSAVPLAGPDSIDTHALLLDASTVCGVVDSGVGSVAVRPGWAASPAQVDAAVERMSDGALLAPVGAAREIARLRRAARDLVEIRAELDRRHAEIVELNAELARRPVRAVRRAANMVNRVLRRT